MAFYKLCAGILKYSVLTSELMRKRDAIGNHGDAKGVKAVWNAVAREQISKKIVHRIFISISYGPCDTVKTRRDWHG